MPVLQPIRKSSKPAMRVDDLAAFIVERHNIYRRRRRGEPKPWTTDPILQRYRFCNMYRELDKETVWIKDNWREPHSGNPDLWFALVVARLVNRHESLEAIGYPVPWNPDHFLAVARDWKEHKRKPAFYNGAYVIPAGHTPGVPKPVFQVETIFNPMWRDRESLRTIVNGTLAQAHRRLVE